MICLLGPKSGLALYVGDRAYSISGAALAMYVKWDLAPVLTTCDKSQYLHLVGVCCEIDAEKQSRVYEKVMFAAKLMHKRTAGFSLAEEAFQLIHRCD